MGLRSLAGVVLAGALLVSGCSGGDADPKATGADGAAPTLSPKEQKLADTWDEFRAVADEPEVVDLTDVPGPKPKGGYTQAETDALARVAERVLTRSVDPKISSMSPDDAFSYVMRGTDPWTFTHTRGYLIDSLQGAAWQYRAVSQFGADVQAPEPELIGVHWDSWIKEGTMSSGAKAPYLGVALEGRYRSEVEKDGETFPIVVARTVSVASYKPLVKGYTPFISFYTAPFGNDGCQFLRSPELVPLADAGNLGRDLKALKTELASDEVHYPWFEVTAKGLKGWRKTCAKRDRA